LARAFARPGFAFRVIYVATFADVVYVLHAFREKTQRPAKRDVNLAASRLREQIRFLRVCGMR
jgi:phage-related protein